MIVFKLYYTPNSLKMTSEHKGGSHTGVNPSFVFNIDIFVFNIDKDFCYMAFLGSKSYQPCNIQTIFLITLAMN